MRRPGRGPAPGRLSPGGAATTGCGRDDAWATLFTSQNTVTQLMLAAAETGIATTTASDPAHRRLTQMRDFYQFMLKEIPTLLHRWQQHQATHSR
ncbi:hypothetical protein [Nonomuraea insulae]|uniref:Uncharacterized protein n=1 Tax=Nonomuraea insulae TaxID=1616787 RepID=A0ABW1D6W3_9ACTN